jgi:hypothetical protein
LSDAADLAAALVLTNWFPPLLEEILMKKLLLVLMCGAVLGLVADKAHAIPPFMNAFIAKYAGADAKPEFAKSVKEEVKCNVCHVKGEKKEVRNEYGEALKKAGLDKKDFKKERLESEPDAVAKEINAALDKVGKEKNKAGETYESRLKAGKLPVE